MFISEKGIYDTVSVYHDDVDYIWHVKFDDSKDKMTADFKRLCESLRKEGGDQRVAQLKNLLNIRERI